MIGNRPRKVNVVPGGMRLEKLQGMQREVRGKGRGKIEWERSSEKAFPTPSSLILPSLFPLFSLLSLQFTFTLPSPIIPERRHPWKL
jgi:hypothetical protein